MDPRLLHLATVLGLSASVGLNTTLPLLIIGVLHDVGLLHLTPPYDALGGPIILTILGVLVLIELVGDKVDGLHPFIHTFQTPLTLCAGAIVAGSQAQAISSVNPELVIAIGLTTAGASHMARGTLRSVVRSVPIVGNSLASGIEDISALSLTGIALAAPPLVPFVLAGLLAAWVGSLFLLWRLLDWLRGALSVIINGLLRRFGLPTLGNLAQGAGNWLSGDSDGALLPPGGPGGQVPTAGITIAGYAPLNFESRPANGAALSSLPNGKIKPGKQRVTIADR